MTIEEARGHIGDGVVYLSGSGRAEDGVITSVSDRFAFVRYAGDQHSKATDPADLDLLAVSREEMTTALARLDPAEVAAAVERAPLTGGEFEAGYAARSGVTVTELHRLGRYPEPCDCGQVTCQGWGMGHQHDDAIFEEEQRGTDSWGAGSGPGSDPAAAGPGR